MTDLAALANAILLRDKHVMYGIFGLVAASGCFPPRPLLNEFLAQGCDPCDQDGRMESWPPFALSDAQYLLVSEQWIATHPGATVDALGVGCWADWASKIIER